MSMISRQEILLWDLVQTDPDRKRIDSPEKALMHLKYESEWAGDPQDFGYDAEKWKAWLLIHSPGFKRWMDYQEELTERIRANKKSASKDG